MFTISDPGLVSDPFSIVDCQLPVKLVQILQLPKTSPVRFHVGVNVKLMFLLLVVVWLLIMLSRGKLNWTPIASTKNTDRAKRANTETKNLRFIAPSFLMTHRTVFPCGT